MHSDTERWTAYSCIDLKVHVYFIKIYCLYKYLGSLYQCGIPVWHTHIQLVPNGTARPADLYLSMQGLPNQSLTLCLKLDAIQPGLCGFRIEAFARFTPKHLIQMQ